MDISGGPFFKRLGDLKLNFFFTPFKTPTSNLVFYNPPPTLQYGVPFNNPLSYAYTHPPRLKNRLLQGGHHRDGRCRRAGGVTTGRLAVAVPVNLDVTGMSTWRIQVSKDKKAPGCLGYIGGEILPWYMGIIS